MARLYFRIYLAVLASLALFAILAAITWRLAADGDRFNARQEFYLAVAEKLAPPAAAPPEEQRQILREWRDRSGFDVAIFAPDGLLIAESGGIDISSIPMQHRRQGSARWYGRPWLQSAELSDGRTLVAMRPAAERSEARRFLPVFALLGIGIAVAIAAYPVVRRLTRRLETLQTSVAALGAGDLSARVKVEGKDEVGRLAETFNHAADRIQSLVVANKSLLANASHELRSPLARLRMGLESLPDATSAATKNEIRRNIHELDKLIEEILLASRIDAAGEAVMSREPIDVVGLVAEECALTEARLDLAGTDLPVVNGDPSLLRRLIRNLLQNAERYGGGAAEVTVMQTAHSVELAIADRGPGVPEAERERIFEPFYRVKGSREKDGAVGLGLALVQDIARRHGGSAICQPREGGGSIFRVTLPRISAPLT
jgi:signal transduction histidine kinase